MNDEQDMQVMTQVARLYYLQDYKMERIATRLGVSRSTVSRLLKRARKTGIVTIELQDPGSIRDDLAAALWDRYGVRSHIVHVSELSDSYDRLEAVAVTAARLLAMWMDSNMVLGVAWGTTTMAISQCLRPKSTVGSLIVQLNGAANWRSTQTAYYGAIMTRFAEAFDARALDFPVPTFFDRAETRQLMWQERSVRGVLEAQAHVDIAVFSVGARNSQVPSRVWSADYLTKKDDVMLRREKVVGDVCTVFLRADGTYADIEINARATGPAPDRLKRFTRRMCVVSGENKALALLAALRAGVVTDLIVDEPTLARALACEN